MKTKKLLALFLMTITLGITGSSFALDKKEYVDSVMNIIRSHVNLLEELSVTDRFKYSNNLVRHAIAVEDAFGLLGPMEWHSAQAAKFHKVKHGSKGELDEDRFEDLARASRKSLKTLVRAAHDSMEEYEANGVRHAIDEMKESCNNCHNLLPKSVAPDIWGSLERE